MTFEMGRGVTAWWSIADAFLLNLSLQDVGTNDNLSASKKIAWCLWSWGDTPLTGWRRVMPAWSLSIPHPMRVHWGHKSLSRTILISLGQPNLWSTSNYVSSSQLRPQNLQCQIVDAHCSVQFRWRCCYHIVVHCFMSSKHELFSRSMS